jgi:hypothetical protein
MDPPSSGAAAPAVSAAPPGPTPWPRVVRLRRALWPAYARSLASTSAPILVGPWRGELGYEAFYWQPWIAQWMKRWRIDPARVIPIARGGTGVLYGCPRGVELYGLRTPDEVAVQVRLDQRRTGWAKQLTVTPFDRQVLRDVARTLGLRRYRVLHPAWMYADLEPFIQTERGLRWVLRRMDLGRVAPPPLPDGLTLPEPYVAVRFYARATYPVLPVTTDFAREAIRQMARQFHVVILNADSPDEHVDYHPERSDRVIYLSDRVRLTPDTVLGTQAAVMARALGFVGTYGGLAHLALRLGTPSIGFYWDWHGTTPANRHLTAHLSLVSGQPGLVMGLADLAVLQQVVPVLQLRMKSASVGSSSVVAAPTTP